MNSIRSDHKDKAGMAFERKQTGCTRVSHYLLGLLAPILHRDIIDCAPISAQILIKWSDDRNDCDLHKMALQHV